MKPCDGFTDRTPTNNGTCCWRRAGRTMEFHTHIDDPTADTWISSPSPFTVPRMVAAPETED